MSVSQTHTTFALSLTLACSGSFVVYNLYQAYQFKYHTGFGLDTQFKIVRCEALLAEAADQKPGGLSKNQELNSCQQLALSIPKSSSHARDALLLKLFRLYVNREDVAQVHAIAQQLSRWESVLEAIQALVDSSKTSQHQKLLASKTWGAIYDRAFQAYTKDLGRTEMINQIYYTFFRVKRKKMAKMVDHVSYAEVFTSSLSQPFINFKKPLELVSDYLNFAKAAGAIQLLDRKESALQKAAACIEISEDKIQQLQAWEMMMNFHRHQKDKERELQCIVKASNVFGALNIKAGVVKKLYIEAYLRLAGMFYADQVATARSLLELALAPICTIQTHYQTTAQGLRLWTDGVKTILKVPDLATPTPGAVPPDFLQMILEKAAKVQESANQDIAPELQAATNRLKTYIDLMKIYQNIGNTQDTVMMVFKKALKEVKQMSVNKDFAHQEVTKLFQEMLSMHGSEDDPDKALPVRTLVEDYCSDLSKSDSTQPSFSKLRVLYEVLVIYIQMPWEEAAYKFFQKYFFPLFEIEALPEDTISTLVEMASDIGLITQRSQSVLNLHKQFLEKAEELIPQLKNQESHERMMARIARAYLQVDRNKSIQILNEYENERLNYHWIAFSISAFVTAASYWFYSIRSRAFISDLPS